MSAKYHIVWNSGEGVCENYNIKWSNIQLLEEDEHGRGSWNLLNARQKPEQANLLISGYPDRNSTQLQMILWTAPLQHIRFFGIIGLLPPWPLMVPFSCHQSQRSPLFFHLVRKKPLVEKVLWSILRDMTNRAHLPGRMTNHSARTTACTELIHACIILLLFNK